METTRFTKRAILAPDLRGANYGGVSMASYLSTELTIRAAAGLPTSSELLRQLVAIDRT
jgi:hypothetical protein